MKKNPLFLLAVPTLIFTLFGCNQFDNPESRKVKLDYGLIRETSQEFTDNIKYETLTSMINQKRSFALAISNEGCGCWSGFDPILAQLNNKYNLDIRNIDCAEFENVKDKYGLYTVCGDIPALAFFKKGVLQSEVTYLGNNSRYRNVFTDYKTLEKYFFDHAYLPKMYNISEVQLDAKIASNETFNVYFGTYSCPDCSTFARETLNDWNDSNTSINVGNYLYVFDISDYFNNRRASSEGQEAYTKLMKKYGLSEETNPTLGYSTGKIPTLQRRNGNTIVDMIVPLNDSYSKEDYKVTSYFTETRVANMPCLKNQQGNFILDGTTVKESQTKDWRATQLKLQSPMIKIYLDTYLK